MQQMRLETAFQVPRQIALQLGQFPALQLLELRLQQHITKQLFLIQHLQAMAELRLLHIRLFQAPEALLAQFLKRGLELLLLMD